MEITTCARSHIYIFSLCFFQTIFTVRISITALWRCQPKANNKEISLFSLWLFSTSSINETKIVCSPKKKLIPSQRKCTSFVTSVSNTVTPFAPPPTSHCQQTLLFVAAALVITRKGRFLVFYLPHVNDEVAIRSWGHLLSSLSLPACVCVCVCMICLFPTRLTSSLESSSHGLEHALYRALASLTCTHLSLLPWLTPRHQKSRPPIAACCFISHSDQICVGSFFFFFNPRAIRDAAAESSRWRGRLSWAPRLEKLDENAVRGTERKKISPLQITPNCPPQISSRACSCS